MNKYKYGKEPQNTNQPKNMKEKRLRRASPLQILSIQSSSLYYISYSENQLKYTTNVASRGTAHKLRPKVILIYLPYS